VERTRRIVIIGAGIGGMAAAGALRQRGFEVAVYERAPELGEVGAGLQLGPNAVKVLAGLGIADRLRPLAAEPRDILSLAWDDGHLRYREPLRDISAERYGASYLTAHRADLHRLLQALVPDSSIHLNARCEGVAISGRSAVARFADGREVEADVIIGADGIHSAVRNSLFGESKARFTQQIAWRAMIPVSEVPSRVGPGGSVALDPQDYAGWIGPNGHVICYPIRGGEIYNLFIGHVSEEWVEESWTAPSTVAEILEAHSGWNEALLDMLSKVSNVYKWGIYDRDPLPYWSSGPVTLVGDSAHPMMPTLAQGAAITLEDSYAVARHLDRGRDDIHAALKAYEAERQPRASRVQLQARTQFENNRKSPAPPPLSRDWIFEHDARQEPMAA